MTTQTLARPAVAPPGARAAHWAPLAVVLTGTFMVVLDFFIINVALPAMQHSLHASSGSLEWVIAAYALSCSVFVITGGRLGDRFGRRRAFCTGLALFTASSAICGAAPNATVLDLSRALQGVGGAIVMPTVLAIVGVAYTGEDRTKAFAAYGIVMGIAAVAGQLIGGALVQADVLSLSWRACFLINLPVGLAVLALAPRLVPESRGAFAGRFDLGGVALATLALVAIVLPLVQGRQLGWPAWTWISLGLSPALVAALIVQQRRLTRAGGAPLLRLSLFSHRTFTAGLLTQFVFWSGQASFFLVLAIYLQDGRGMTPLDAGLFFTVLAGTYVVASMRAPQLAVRHGRRVLTAAALTLAAGHLTLLAGVAVVGTGGSLWALVPGLLLIGAGMGLGLAPLATVVLSAMEPEYAGAAAGMLSTAQNVGNALGVAIVGVVFFGSLHAGSAVALERSLGVLAGALVLAAVASRLLPAPGGAQ